MIPSRTITTTTQSAFAPLVLRKFDQIDRAAFRAHSDGTPVRSVRTGERPDRRHLKLLSDLGAKQRKGMFFWGTLFGTPVVVALYDGPKSIEFKATFPDGPIIAQIAEMPDQNNRGEHFMGAFIKTAQLVAGRFWAAAQGREFHDGDLQPHHYAIYYPDPSNQE